MFRVSTQGVDQRMKKLRYIIIIIIIIIIIRSAVFSLNADRTFKSSNSSEIPLPSFCCN